MEAANKLDTIKTAADNVKCTLEKMFMDDDHIAVYIFCAVVLIICSITLVRVYRFEAALLCKVEEISKNVRSRQISEKEFVPPYEL